MAGIVLVAVAAGGVLGARALLWPARPVPDFETQACALPSPWLERIQRGFNEPRSGQISILPRTPMYMASGAGGWSHSGPWDYLQDIPLVFYGPGIVPAIGEVARPVTLADVAPTMAELVGWPRGVRGGDVLEEVMGPGGWKAPKLIVTVVWDGGGWNTLEAWESSWPELARMMTRGVSYRSATVGSSPSVTPAVHSTLGTGVFPAMHGITGVPLRDERGEVVDAFLKGESARFLETRTFAELWDERVDGRAEVGMVGYEPWHLGMIGAGAEVSSGDKDDAAWLDIKTNEWITNETHYSLPAAIARTAGLDEDLATLDAEDGAVDGSWLDHPILSDRARIEETPAFIRYHARVLVELIAAEGYGRDSITDLLFTNFKQIDRVGHYFNMASEEVEQSLRVTDEQLPILTDELDDLVGRGRWVLIVTADHGQQPDAPEAGGYGIRPKEVAADIRAEFGPVVEAVWPTEVFLDDDALAEHDVTIEEIARWLGEYEVGDNIEEGLGEEENLIVPRPERVFEMAIPARLLPGLRC
ncbi:MAG TPA: alkaline phosphatase family protein [Actinomycetota bacterium]|nr:alkaline phosphatase family protein [Actinomycetota bacterium]